MQNVRKDIISILKTDVQIEISCTVLNEIILVKEKNNFHFIQKQTLITLVNIQKVHFLKLKKSTILLISLI